MKSTYLLATLLLLLAAPLGAPTASADDPEKWLTRCNMEIGDSNDPESAEYTFETRGKAEGAQGRASMSYSAAGRVADTIYLTDAKGMLNPYKGASLGVGYYGLVDGVAPYAVAPAVGHVRIGVVAKNSDPIDGAITMKLVVDGKTFGPYQPKESIIKFGQYSVWLDTAETDGDSKPPLLTSQQFATLANAIDAMSAVEVVLIKDGVDVARLPVPMTLFTKWRSELPKWASETRPGLSGTARCRAGGFLIN